MLARPAAAFFWTRSDVGTRRDEHEAQLVAQRAEQLEPVSGRRNVHLGLERGSDLTRFPAILEDLLDLRAKSAQRGPLLEQRPVVGNLRESIHGLSEDRFLAGL